ncbi:MAG: hypothetical protein RQ745_05090 [Longimicrobiales bacterium]|nr:hypothetical protein [Longimicrobiales bacterium]
MRIPLHLALAALALHALPGSLRAQTYYEDVRPVLVDTCMGCHSEAGVAWSMESAERTYERARRIARAVDARRMPPFIAAPGHQEYVGDVSLDDKTIAMIRRWAEAGYPKGDARPDPTPPPLSAQLHHPRFEGDVSLDVLGEGGYLPDQESSDDYRCFLVDWNENTETFMTGFRARPGNRNVAHHTVVYAVEPEMWSRYREIETIDEGPGYTCFGGALPDRLVEPERRAEYEERYPDGVLELARANWWLAHWAPGMDGHVFPEGTGIRMKPGSGLVVQMHYYAETAPGERDVGTAIDFMTAPAVERPAMHLSQTFNPWLAGVRNGTMVIPEGEMRTYEYGSTLGSLLNYIARLTGVSADEVSGLEVHSANLHMHAMGHSGEVTLRHPSGRVETLLEVPRWDLRWQRDFTFTAPKIFSREALDQVRLAVRCTFENTTEATVFGGYGSGDEMCFNFSYIAVQTPESGDAARE